MIDNIEMLPDDVDDLAEIEEEDDFASRGWTGQPHQVRAEDAAEKRQVDDQSVNEKRARREAELKFLKEEGITLSRRRRRTKKPSSSNRRLKF